MANEEEGDSGTVSFPRKVDSKPIMIGPIPASRMVVLILSAAVGGWLSYGVLTRFPHSFAVYLLATMVFLFTVGMGGGIVYLASVSVRVVARRFGDPRPSATCTEHPCEDEGAGETAPPFPR